MQCFLNVDRYLHNNNKLLELFESINRCRLTPAMGYNTWNDFRCNGISAANIMAVADKMVELGLLQVGFNHVNIDDCLLNYLHACVHLWSGMHVCMHVCMHVFDPYWLIFRLGDRTST
jgi:hypothetical protein